MCGTMSCSHPKMRSLGLLALRIAVGIIFVYSGYGKLGPEHASSIAGFAKLGFSSAEFWVYLSGVLEVLGGLMVLFGVFAGYAATWLAFMMVVGIVAIARTGAPFSGLFMPIMTLGACLALVGNGAGCYRLVKTECHCAKCKAKEGKNSCCGGKEGCDCCKK